MKEYLAVDLGASSGRHILGRMEDGRLVLEEIYRFEHKAVEVNGHLCWQLDGLWQNIVAGLKKCNELGRIPTTMAIDTWGVDFVLLDGENNRLGDPIAYRDKRTEGMDKVLEQVISQEELYARTGIQKQPFNTIYQLLALREQTNLLDRAQSMLMLPEYFNFLLTGVKKREYTNATTGNLVDVRTCQWDMELIERLGLPKRLFDPLCQPGTVVGNLTKAMQQEVGFDCTVLLPATHDTGSAYLAVPAKDDKAAYLSSGTWSLLGVENDTPITSEASRQANFTNEGGYPHKYRFLKNIMGLWMLQSMKREWNGAYSFAQMEELARKCPDFPSIVDVNDDCFLAPASMIGAVQAYCEKTGQQVPQGVGELTVCVYHSLAKGYAAAIREMESFTGKTYDTLHIVGGGSKDGYLNELTAKAAGIPVMAGPTEGTALGNLIIQWIADGVFADVTQAREAIVHSFPIRTYQP